MRLTKQRKNVLAVLKARHDGLNYANHHLSYSALIGLEKLGHIRWVGGTSRLAIDRIWRMRNARNCGWFITKSGLEIAEDLVASDDHTKSYFDKLIALKLPTGV